MNPVSRFASPLLLLVVSILVADAASAATYLPLADEQLAARSPVIVRAKVLGQETRVATVDGTDTVVTVTRFRTLEVLKGEIASETFRIELPGGVAGEVATWVPGTPSFAAQSEVILFLSPTMAGDDAFSLTEFGLSKFDVVQDRAQRRFAVRSVFRAEEDDFLALGENAVSPGADAPRSLRDADSFAASLASEAAGRGFPPVVYAAPEGEIRGSQGAHPLWVNIGGAEGSGGLYRWFWDTGDLPPPSSRPTAFRAD